MPYKKAHKSQDGFTMVEFLIATAVFSMVMLVCAFAIVHIGRMYYKGVITNRTQDTARRVVDDIAGSIQFGASDVRDEGTSSLTVAGYPSITAYARCIGSTRYSYVRDRSLNADVAANDVSIPHVLWKDRVITGACTPLDLTQANPTTHAGVSISQDGQELVGKNMRVPALDFTRAGSLWTVNVRIAYGNTADLFEDPANFSICRGVIAGGQFCSVSAYNTKVTRRLD